MNFGLYILRNLGDLAICNNIDRPKVDYTFIPIRGRKMLHVLSCMCNLGSWCHRNRIDKLEKRWDGVQKVQIFRHGLNKFKRLIQSIVSWYVWSNLKNVCVLNHKTII